MNPGVAKPGFHKVVIYVVYVLLTLCGRLMFLVDWIEGVVLRDARMDTTGINLYLYLKANLVARRPPSRSIVKGRMRQERRCRPLLWSAKSPCSTELGGRVFPALGWHSVVPAIWVCL